MRNLRVSCTLNTSHHNLLWNRDYKVETCQPFGQNVVILREEAPKLAARGVAAIYLGIAHDGILAINLHNNRVINS